MDLRHLVCCFFLCTFIVNPRILSAGEFIWGDVDESKLGINDYASIENFLEHEEGNIPGKYLVNVYINDIYVDSAIVDNKLDDTGEVMPCIDSSLVRQISQYLQIDTDFDVALSSNYVCSWSEYHPLLTSELDTNQLVYRLWVPDELLIKDGVQNRVFDEGVNGAFLTYALSVPYNEDSGDTRVSTVLNAGVNLSDWQLRVDAASRDVADEDLDYSNLFVSKKLFPIYSELKIGQVFTSSAQFDSFQYEGVNLSSDLLMLPSRYRYYTPAINAYANVNSTLEIYQGTRLIDTRQVGAGPLLLSDLPISSGENVRLVFTGVDGSIDIQEFPVGAISGMLTEGIRDYNLAAGNYTNAQGDRGEAFFQAEYGYGLTSSFTPLAGVLLAADYRSASLGGAFRIGSLGAMNLIANFAQYDGRDYGDQSEGGKVSLDYNKFLYGNDGSTSFVLSYDHQSEQFYDFSDAMDNLTWGDERFGANKNRASASVSHPVWNGSLTANTNYYDYWDRDDSVFDYGLSYSNSLFERLTYFLNVNRTDYKSRDSETRISVQFNLPIFSGYQKLTNAFTRFYHSDSQITSEFGVNGNYYGMNYSVSDRYDHKNNRNAVSASANYNLPFTHVSASAYHSEGTTNYALGAKGTVLTAQKALLFSPSVQESFSVIDTSNIGGVYVNNQATNEDGLALVGVNGFYGEQNYHVDENKLSPSIKMYQFDKMIYPSKGSITHIHFKAERVLQVTGSLRQQNGKPVPLGTILQLPDGTQTLVGRDGQFYFTLTLAEELESHNQPIKAGFEGQFCDFYLSQEQAISQDELINLGRVLCI